MTSTSVPDSVEPAAPSLLSDETRERLADPRFTAAGLLFEAADGLRDAISEAIDGTAPGGAEMQVLMRLARSPGTRLRLADLAAQVAMSASGLTRLIDRLERDGLVQRSACPTDRRGAFAVLTDDGLAVITNSLDVHLAAITASFTGLLSPDELEDLLGSLRTVRDVVRPGAAAGTVGDGSCEGEPRD